MILEVVKAWFVENGWYFWRSTRPGVEACFVRADYCAGIQAQVVEGKLTFTCTNLAAQRALRSALEATEVHASVSGL